MQCCNPGVAARGGLSVLQVVETQRRQDKVIGKQMKCSSISRLPVITAEESSCFLIPNIVLL